MPAHSKKSIYFPYAKGLYEKGYSLTKIAKGIPDVHYNTLSKWFKEDGIVVERRRTYEPPLLIQQVCGYCKQIFIAPPHDMFCSKICNRAFLREYAQKMFTKKGL